MEIRLNATDDSDAARPRSGFFARLRLAFATPRFWFTVALQSIPVLGVIRFGWSAQQIGMYFVLQSWLMLSIYGATNATFNPKWLKGKAPPQGMAAVMNFGIVLLIGSLLLALAIVWLGVYFNFVMLNSFFGSGEYLQRSFQIGVAALVCSCIADGTRYVLVFRRRTPLQVAVDDARFRSLGGRVIVLFLLGWFIGLLQMFNKGWANAALAIVVSCLQIYCDGIPPRLAAWPKRDKT